MCQHITHCTVTFVRRRIQPQMLKMLLHQLILLLHNSEETSSVENSGPNATFRDSGIETQQQ